MDRRTPLLPGHTLIVYADPREEGQGVVFQICGEIDRGRSCIVYDGSYRDSVDAVHLARLKECYPRQEGLCRDENGRICVRAAWKEGQKDNGAGGASAAMAVHGHGRGYGAKEHPDEGYPGEGYADEGHPDKEHSGEGYSGGEEQARTLQADLKRFGTAKERFIDAYRMQVELSKKAGLSNRILHAFQIYYGNNTLYSVMDYTEGTDYGKIGKEEIGKVIRRIRAVAMALEQYHKRGFLYLDIKPENIWIIWESDDMVYLFDHDSVVRMEELPGLCPKDIACTKGFEAPEILRGDVRSIGLAADMYGLGALFYYKLMGVCPGRRERERGARYDFAAIEKENPLCRPLVFKRIGQFFSRTLAAAREVRFGTMGEAAMELEKLMKLCDPSAVYALDNFVYHQNCFIGRDRELEQMERRLDHMHVLFLHGIGGIGKTELALRYGYKNRDRYDTILFLRVEEGLLESLGREDVSLRGFAREEEEELNEYVTRKLEALRACLTGADLLILDNFDEEDGFLEEVLSLPCHIVITSRQDFRDWNYPQMEVYELDGEEEVMELFRAYNAVSYEEEEMEAVRDMIQYMDYHTMLTELLAKHLRVSGLSPREVKKRMEGELGIIGLSREEVRHRKGKTSLQTSVQNHLRILFDTSSLGQEEVRILEDLSLFAGVRLDREMFLEWRGGDLRDREDLERLVLRGWVEEWEDKKVSLHQIVLDLVYGECYRGKEENNGNLIRALAKYASSEFANQMEREIRNELCAIFGNRLQGRDEAALDFYLSYCECIRNKEQWMDICLEEWGKHPESHSERFARVCVLKGKAALEEMTDIDCFLDEELQRQEAEKAVEWFGKGERYQKEGRFLFTIGKICYKAMENLMVNEPAVLVGCRAGEDWMERGVRLYEQDPGRDDKILSSMYEDLMDFYDPEALVMIRPEHFANLDKRLFYGRKRQELGLWEGYMDLNSFSYTEAAEQAERQGNVEAAVKYYEMAMAADEEDFVFFEDKLGLLYETLGEYGKAVDLFQKVFEEREEGRMALHLGRIYGELGEMDKAFQWLEKGIKLCRKKSEDGGGPYWKAKVLEGYLEGAKMPGAQGREFWTKGTAYYEREKGAIKGEKGAIGFQIAYGKRFMEEAEKKAGGGDSEEFEKAGELFADAAKNCLENYMDDRREEMAGLLERAAERIRDPWFWAQASYLRGRLAVEFEDKDEEMAKAYYDRSREILEDLEKGCQGHGEKMEICQEQRVLFMELWDNLASGYASIESYDQEEQCRSRCDHELLAWKKVRELEQNGDMDRDERLKKQMEVWEDSGAICRNFWKFGNGFGVGNEGGDETAGERDRRLSMSIRCYTQAREAWRQMRREERLGSLYKLSHMMKNWSDAELERGHQTQAREVLLWWREEIFGLWARDQENDKTREFSGQLRDVAERLEKAGDKESAILCRLEGGILGLGAAYEPGSVKTASQVFFERVRFGIEEREIDDILGVCDHVIRLCGRNEAREELRIRCGELAKRYREKKISFK